MITAYARFRRCGRRVGPLVLAVVKRMWQRRPVAMAGG